MNKQVVAESERKQRQNLVNSVNEAEAFKALSIVERSAFTLSIILIKVLLVSPTSSSIFLNPTQNLWILTKPCKTPSGFFSKPHLSNYVWWKSIDSSLLRVKSSGSLSFELPTKWVIIWFAFRGRMEEKMDQTAGRASGCGGKWQQKRSYCTARRCREQFISISCRSGLMGRCHGELGRPVREGSLSLNQTGSWLVWIWIPFSILWFFFFFFSIQSHICFCFRILALISYLCVEIRSLNH